jgi:anti-sigma factor RsiW
MIDRTNSTFASPGCDRSADVHRYHDGELDADAVASFERHVDGCASCESLLGELRQLSKSFAEFRPPVPSDAWVESLGEDGAVAARESGVRRLAGWMTSAAAAVLAGAMLWSPAPATPGEERPASGTTWAEAVAVMPPARTRDDSGGHLVQVAQFMASDLAADERW